MGAQVRCFRELWVQRVDAGASLRAVALEHAARGGSDLVTVDADDGARVLVAAAPGSDDPLLDLTAAVVDTRAADPVIVLPGQIGVVRCAVRHWIEFTVDVEVPVGVATDDLVDLVRVRLAAEPHDVLVTVSSGAGAGERLVGAVRVVPSLDGTR